MTEQLTIIENDEGKWYREPNDNIIYCDVKEGAIVDMDAAISSVNNVGKLLKDPNEKFYLIVDLTLERKLTREAREHFGRTDHGFLHSALGLVSRSLVANVIGNFLIGVNKNKIPTKIFKNKKAAIKWVRKF